MSSRSVSRIALLAAAAFASVAAMAENPSSDIPLPEFMGHVLQRNAEQLWAWSAEESDGTGAHSGAPRTEEEWEAAESDALTLDQLSYVLQGLASRPDDPRWDKLATDLRSAATASASAAERKDYPALLAAGEDINARCVACHWTFAPQLEVTPPPVPLS
ncbi:hypothetical protein H7F51_07910 [Novosphingobium flavum]|uniref:Cytochrome C n=1 Tax=Novosphingobium flavum TaxID=1778672 RepID=A0A7X1KLL8_9SPHN|nr:hypothetical protein [Novosphingobium flavum]MBC2665443.1 hypothetical protein [Novosphingobium flavum]